MHIGSVCLRTPFILAPLAGYTDLPFRLLCKEYGAALTVSEMISCHGLTYGQPPTIRMLSTTLAEAPFAVQLFGAEPEIMGEAAAILSSYPLDIIDINMGCPVRKVVKKGAGAALMRTPVIAAKIIRQVVKNSKRPVSVKFRSGWNHQEINAARFAQMAEEAGAAAVTVHGRTWSDGFSGRADWQIIKKVRESVSIPVIGNGDIGSYEDGQRMLAETGCAAVMIGRAALGAPWVFKPQQASPPMAVRITALSRHLELISQYTNPGHCLGRIKNHAGRYFKGIPGGAAIRKEIYAAASFQQLTQFLTHINGNISIIGGRKLF
jgi:nifR3 family TIM-barrel protein